MRNKEMSLEGQIFSAAFLLLREGQAAKNDDDWKLVVKHAEDLLKLGGDSQKVLAHGLAYSVMDQLGAWNIERKKKNAKQ